jgi:hypothetical protein
LAICNWCISTPSTTSSVRKGISKMVGVSEGSTGKEVQQSARKRIVWLDIETYIKCPTYSSQPVCMYQVEDRISRSCTSVEGTFHQVQLRCQIRVRGQCRGPRSLEIPQYNASIWASKAAPYLHAAPSQQQDNGTHNHEKQATKGQGTKKKINTSSIENSAPVPRCPHLKQLVADDHQL